MSFPDLDHSYNDDVHFERVTPLEEIPEEFRLEASLIGGEIQIIDMRLAYCFNREIGFLVECGSKAGDAHKWK